MSELLKQLRAVDDEAIQRALDGAYVAFPINNAAEFAEAFQRVLGEVAGHWGGDDQPSDEYVSVPRLG
ncbi:hypothetical protein GRI97_08005 [Altererythrobacter xixiisoli]|uniref:Uncharacterized protein n=1 Tax=Croceibacterium xixiisoli TaxID=1476466 RepID=A0A6I4TUI8_9SPHN|nr:hypothetical protein [Croceibacterium xixiisoli]MXO98929.1 hypothetical protein [Croceibacterium xixiisoli]